LPRPINDDNLIRCIIRCPYHDQRNNNQIRRKVYSVIRDFRENILPGYRIVVCVKEPIIKADAKVISEQARIIFVKTGLLK
jgi:ribonuclease P protein component